MTHHAIMVTSAELTPESYAAFFQRHYDLRLDRQGFVFLGSAAHFVRIKPPEWDDPFYDQTNWTDEELSRLTTALGAEAKALFWIEWPDDKRATGVLLRFSQTFQQAFNAVLLDENDRVWTSGDITAHYHQFPGA